MEKRSNQTIQQAIKYCRFQKDRNWRNFQQCKSLLEKALSDLSTKKEEELSKKDLLYLVSCNCDYMRSLSLYNYYKDELSKLLTKEISLNKKQEEHVEDYDGPYDSVGSLDGEKYVDEDGKEHSLHFLGGNNGKSNK